MADHRTRRRALAKTATGAEPIGATRHDEPFTGARGTLQERVARSGHPLQLQLLTSLDGVTAPGLYPSDGAGVALGGGPGFIDLAADAPDFRLGGMGIAVWDTDPSTGWQPELYRVAAYNTSSKRAMLSYWDPDEDSLEPHPPRAGSHYTLGIITWQREFLRITPEYEASGTIVPAVVLPFYSDFNQEPPETGDDAGQLAVFGTAREIRWVSSVQLSLDKYGVQVLLRRPGYFNGRTRTDESLGGLMCKVLLVSAPSAGRVALCASAT